jgi:hypothetical protein
MQSGEMRPNHSRLGNWPSPITLMLPGALLAAPASPRVTGTVPSCRTILGCFRCCCARWKRAITPAIVPTSIRVGCGFGPVARSSSLPTHGSCFSVRLP